MPYLMTISHDSAIGPSAKALDSKTAQATEEAPDSVGEETGSTPDAA
jgi:hypothetical protein